MATVNFQCPHCHNLMAVGQEFLGQQVRCPHCQQVVLAPPPTPPGPEAPGLQVPGRDEPDSIFTPPEISGEDLFGGAPDEPRVEIPTEPAFPRLGLDEQTLPSGEVPPPRSPEVDQPTLTYTGPEPSFPPSGTEVLAPDGPAAPAGEGPFATPGAALPAPAEEEGLPPIPTVPKPRPARGGGWVIAILIVPLISYSILATIAIIILLSEKRNQRHPLEIIPDLEGDNKGGATRGGGKRGSVDYNRPNPEEPLPPKMRVPLGQTLAVGDLEVTPQKVERKRIVYDIPGARPEPAQEDSLALHLRLRNRSEDVTFKPMDRFFARARPKQPTDWKQYTILEMGERRFYGGPLKWAPLPIARRNNTLEYVEGQTVDKELKPGEEMQTFVCTNPDEKAAKALDSYQGPLLWRVQLRRGLVRWTTRDGVEREDSATTVAGVEFNSSDVKKAAD